MRRKHRRLDTELASHQPQVQQVRSKAVELLQASELGAPEIQKRVQVRFLNYHFYNFPTGNAILIYDKLKNIIFNLHIR